MAASWQSSIEMKLFTADIIIESNQTECESFMAINEETLLWSLQMFFIEYWNDNQVATDAQSLQDARAFIQRICSTKNFKDLSILLSESKCGFQIKIHKQEI